MNPWFSENSLLFGPLPNQPVQQWSWMVFVWRGLMLFYRSACGCGSKVPYEVYGEVVIYHFLVCLIPYETWEVPVAEVLILDAVVMGDDFACDCVC